MPTTDDAVQDVPLVPGLLTAVQEEATRRNEEVLIRVLTRSCEFAKATFQLEELEAERRHLADFFKKNVYGNHEYYLKHARQAAVEEEFSRLSHKVSQVLEPCGECFQCLRRQLENAETLPEPRYEKGYRLRPHEYQPKRHYYQNAIPANDSPQPVIVRRARNPAYYLTGEEWGD